MDLKLGIKVKLKRLERGLTQDTLATRVGFTRSYISLIENNRKIPSIAALYKISNVLNVSFDDFFGTDNQNIPSSITRNLFQVDLCNHYALGYGYKVLFCDKMNKVMDVFMIKISSASKTAVLSHGGQEFLFILYGILKLYHGEQEHILERGDSIYIDSSLKHQFENVGSQDVYFLSVNTNKF
ncbi:MAG: XRE family transcriptional regulator [Desulfovermiculus sp.]|nr:XRE family transcriptional regulator [Desulfovermiculus sp.]